MKDLKMLGFAVVTVVALLAFVGTGMASAETTACKDTAGVECYGKGTEIHAVLLSGTHATLTPSGFFAEDVTCEFSTLRSSIATQTTPHGNVSQFTLICGNRVTILSGGTLTIHHEGGHNANLTWTGFEFEVEQNGLTCTFGGTVAAGMTLTGGAPAKIDLTATIPGLSGFPCPSSAVLHAEYTVTSPQPLYAVTGI